MNVVLSTKFLDSTEGHGAIFCDNDILCEVKLPRHVYHWLQGAIGLYNVLDNHTSNHFMGLVENMITESDRRES